MNPKELELILTRQLAECLAMPIFLVDVAGNLLFFNEPAEHILGRRFEETGELPMADWAEAFSPTDHEGRRIEPDQLPLVVALREWRPAHADFRVVGLDRVSRHIHVTAFPLTGRGNRRVGAVAVFWED